MATGSWSTPIIFGTEKPYTSASSRPTWAPVWARATARLTVTDDLPTPPLPEEIPMTLVRDPGAMICPVCRARRRRLASGGLSEPKDELGRLFLVHRGEGDDHLSHVGQGGQGTLHALDEAVASGPAGGGLAQGDRDRLSLHPDRSHQAELADAPQQLGVLDPHDGGAHFRFAHAHWTCPSDSLTATTDSHEGRHDQGLRRTTR